jgi:hypothetical protein
VTAPKGRPKVASATGELKSSADKTPEEFKSIAQGVGANFGTYSVNESEKTITLRTESALYPNAEGTELTTKVVSINGDELRTNGALGNTVWLQVAPKTKSSD